MTKHTTRSRHLPKKRRQFQIALRDLQALWFEHLKEQHQVGGYPDLGGIASKAIEGLPEFQRFVEERSTDEKVQG